MSKFRTLGDLARDLGDFGKAAEHYRRHVAEHPVDAAIWVQLGHAMKEHLGPEHAIEPYRKATLCAPDDQDAHVHLAHALKAVGRTPEAAEVFRVALSQGATAALVRELTGLGESVELEAQEAPEDTLYIWVEDFLGYLRVHTTMSGIQRVHAGIAEYVLARKLARVRFIVPAMAGELAPGSFYEIPQADIGHIVRYVTGRTVHQDRLRSLIEEAERGARVIRLKRGDTIMLLGAFWFSGGETVHRLLQAKACGARVGAYIYDLIPITHPEYRTPELVFEFGRSLCEAIASSRRATRRSPSAFANRRRSTGGTSSRIVSAGMVGSTKPCPPMNHGRPRRLKCKSQPFGRRVS